MLNFALRRVGNEYHNLVYARVLHFVSNFFGRKEARAKFVIACKRFNELLTSGKQLDDDDKKTIKPVVEKLNHKHVTVDDIVAAISSNLDLQYETDILTFGGFYGAQPAVVRVVNVAHFESRPVTVKTAGTERRKLTFMGKRGR